MLEILSSCLNSLCFLLAMLWLNLAMDYSYTIIDLCTHQLKVNTTICVSSCLIDKTIAQIPQAILLLRPFWLYIMQVKQCSFVVLKALTLILYLSLGMIQVGKLSTGDSLDMCAEDEAAIFANDATIKDMEVVLLFSILLFCSTQF